MYLDFAGGDGEMGGYLRWHESSFWAGVVGVGGHPLVALRDDEVPAPRAGSAAGKQRDVRTDGLWAAVTCETRDEHWSVGMEAFAVGYDDPAVALADERGDRVALGFDLEWERIGELWRVTGDLLIDDAHITIDTLGALSDEPRPVAIGRFDDDTPFVTDDVIPVVGPDGLLAGGVAATETARVELEPRWHAPIKSAAIPRALCRLRPSGVAWVG
jgi:hypothetical protein